MNEQIWFIYLTDHHEGPFTPSEVAAKIAQGAVTAQSLGWKDGMPEWVSIESIPELASAIAGGSVTPAAAAPTPAPAPSPAPAAAMGSEEGFSLAQLLAQQQSGDGAPANDPGAFTNGGLTSATSVLSDMVNSVQASSPLGTGSVSIDAGALVGTAVGTASLDTGMLSAVDPDADVWTLRVGKQVSGLYSHSKLKAMAMEGELPAEALLWRPGWQEFKPLTAVPDVASARRQGNKGFAATKTSVAGAARTGTMGRPSFAPITAAANVGDDEPTDPSIRMDAPAEKGFKGILSRIKGLMKKRNRTEAAPAKASARRSGGGGKMQEVAGRLKALALPLGVVALIGLGVGAYFVLFSSPISSDLDVIPEDLEAMRATVKGSAQAGKIYLALARGTEDNPPDDTAPKFYVASSLPEGTKVTLAVSGQVGTLVNRVSFDKVYSASVGASHMAVFEKVSDDGKPLPMGEYSLKVSAEGAEPIMASRFMGGKKSAIYNDRLKKYKDKLQGEYDKEMQELKELVDTLKSIHMDASKRLGDFKSGWAVPANHVKITADWKGFSTSGRAMLDQLEGKLKGRAANAGQSQTFHPRAFEDVSTTLNQLKQVLEMHGQRLEGTTPTGNVEEIDGLAGAGVASLEQFLAQALVKSPFDVLSIDSVPGGAAAKNPPPAPPAAK